MLPVFEVSGVNVHILCDVAQCYFRLKVNSFFPDNAQKGYFLQGADLLSPFLGQLRKRGFAVVAQ